MVHIYTVSIKKANFVYDKKLAYVLESWVSDVGQGYITLEF